MDMVRNTLRVLTTVLALAATSQAFAADGGTWSVSKSSGEVWITSGGVQQASLNPADNLKPGDTIRTGGNGRVLLMRGEESILIAPNSVVGLPAAAKEGLSTTIIQRAGSILLEVEKRNVKHFEVETPYLAAVVKGTQFRVSVNATSTNVEVLRGQVEVADFRSGQIAQVMPGQSATALEHGKPGLSLSGSGTFNPIEQGKPRASSVDRVPVPKGGLTAPRLAANGQTILHGGLRISSALGETNLDFHKVTRGLARSSNRAAIGSRSADNSVVWNSSTANVANASSSSSSSSSSGGASNASSSATSPVASTIGAVTNVAGGAINGIGNLANGNQNQQGIANGNGGIGNLNGIGNLRHLLR